MADKIVVLVTCGSKREARKIAQALVKEKLAACANVMEAPVKSIYRWKGRIESAREFLMIIKTSRSRFPAVEGTIRRLHSYDLPEMIAVPIVGGSQDYLAWIFESVESET